MTGPRLADPALPLQTMNPHLNAVRACLKPVTFTPPPAAIERLLAQSELQRKELRESYSYVQGNPLLQARVQAAGEAVQQLCLSLRRMHLGGV